jgi:hypothetical protein
MSVIVKNMKMPQKCGKCKLYHVEHPMHCMAVEGHRTVGAPYGMSRPDWCPLVEIPTPHGRLIDADKLKSRLVLDNDSSELQRISADILRWIDIQETVIEGRET